MTTTILENHTVTGDHITASLLIWRRFRLPAPGALEALLEANPGLADLGPVIPVGTVVAVPVRTGVAYDRVDQIRLWDEA